MRLTAECVLVHDDDGWTAELPALGAATSGRTRGEALKGAREILELEALGLMEVGSKAPRMRHVAEVAVLSVDVTEEDAERSRYVTKAQAAEEAGRATPPHHRARRFGQELVSLESIAEYTASPREAGRPPLASA